MVLSYKEPDKGANPLSLECWVRRDSRSRLVQPPIECSKLFLHVLPKGLSKTPALEATFPSQRPRAKAPLRSYLCGAEICSQELPLLWLLGAYRTSRVPNSDATVHA